MKKSVLNICFISLLSLLTTGCSDDTLDGYSLQSSKDILGRWNIYRLNAYAPNVDEGSYVDFFADGTAKFYLVYGDNASQRDYTYKVENDWTLNVDKERLEGHITMRDVSSGNSKEFICYIKDDLMNLYYPGPPDIADADVEYQCNRERYEQFTGPTLLASQRIVGWWLIAQYATEPGPYMSEQYKFFTFYPFGAVDKPYETTKGSGVMRYSYRLLDGWTYNEETDELKGQVEFDGKSHDCIIRGDELVIDGIACTFIDFASK